jgi:hypothetical protein
MGRVHGYVLIPFAGTWATLDLFLTNRPSLINRLKPIPGISDHEALFIDSDVQAKLRRPTSRKIFLWNKTDLEKLQHDMQAFCQSFISKFSTSHPVDSLWSTVYHILEMFVVGIVFGRLSLFVSVVGSLFPFC